MKAAFDKAWHPALLHQLVERQCPTYRMHLLKSFLMDRMIELRYKNATDSRAVTKGSPQASACVSIPMQSGHWQWHWMSFTRRSWNCCVCWRRGFVYQRRTFDKNDKRCARCLRYFSSEWCNSTLSELTTAKTEIVISPRCFSAASYLSAATIDSNRAHCALFTTRVEQKINLDWSRPIKVSRG